MHYYIVDGNNYFVSEEEIGELVPYEVSQNTYNSRKKVYTVSQYKQEIRELKEWFKDNKWQLDKFIIGDWTSLTLEWITFISEYRSKRNRLNQLTTLEQQHKGEIEREYI